MESDEEPDGMAESPEESFDWRQYLEETNSSTPPAEAFHQSRAVPINRFQQGQLLLVRDKHASLMVLAKIVQIHSVWIQYQLMGLRDKNLFWVMCNDRDIKPVEPLETTDNPVTRGAFPVTGFQFTSFRKWISKQYEQNKDKIASPKLFKPIHKEFRPNKNLFEVGMKLAVLDHRNFSEGLYVGTVAAIENKVNLQIEFDGYNTTDIRTFSYRSRDLFPFDYVDKIGAFLDTPPQVKLVPSRKRSTAKIVETKGTKQNTEKPPVEEPPVVEEIAEVPPPATPSQFESLFVPPEPKRKRKKRSSFFLEPLQFMSPSQRAAVLREQMSGVKDKVDDILKKASAELTNEQAPLPMKNPETVQSPRLPPPPPPSAEKPVEWTQAVQLPVVLAPQTSREIVQATTIITNYQQVAQPLYLVPVSSIPIQVVSCIAQPVHQPDLNQYICRVEDGRIVSIEPLKPSTSTSGSSGRSTGYSNPSRIFHC